MLTSESHSWLMSISHACNARNHQVSPCRCTAWRTSWHVCDPLQPLWRLWHVHTFSELSINTSFGSEWRFGRRQLGRRPSQQARGRILRRCPTASSRSQCASITPSRQQAAGRRLCRNGCIRMHLLAINLFQQAQGLKFDGPAGRLS